MDTENKLPFEQRKYEVLVKEESETDPEQGKKPDEKTVQELLEQGIIIVNKPSGPTSHQTSDYLKRILKLKKAGHSGTLDPGVTGVLPVALENATRITQALLKAGKEYVCLMHLHQDVDEQILRKTLKEHFTGTITQLPPVKSAVKRQLRQRKIYYLDIIEIQNKEVLFRVGCEAGTYIRKLVHDIGLKLGCGAHMAELIRTKAGPFQEHQMHTLQDITDAYHYYKQGNPEKLRNMIMPIESGVQHLKKICVHDTTVDPLCHGSYLKIPGIIKIDSDINKNDLVAVLTLKGELVLIGQTLLNANQMNKQAKGIAVKPEQVFMKPGTYKKNEIKEN